MQQQHEQFKTFIASSADECFTQAEIFGANVAAKSLAVIKDGDNIIVSIGYRDDEPAYPISIVCYPLLVASGENRTEIDSKMVGRVAACEDEVLCHSFYHGDGGDTYVALMTR